MAFAPQAQPAPQEQQSQQEQPGKATQLIIKINEDLSSLGDMITQSGLPDSDKQQFSALMGAFNQFVDTLGQKPGQEQQGPAARPPQSAQPRPGMGIVSQEAGGRVPVRPSL